MPDEGQFGELLQHWKSQYLDGDDLVARQLCPSGWSEKQILLLQERIDLLRTEIDKKLDDGFNRWQKCLREGGRNEPTAQNLCPTLPKGLLLRLENRILSNRKQILVERWTSLHRQGVDLTAVELYPQGSADFRNELQDSIYSCGKGTDDEAGRDDLFPTLRQEVENDFKEIVAQRRRNKRECRDYVYEVYEEKGKIWYEAGRQGSPEAMWLVGLCFELAFEDPRTPEDCEDSESIVAHCYKQAADWFQKAAEQGNAEAQYSLALYHRYGLGGRKKDEEEARRLVEKAAEGNQPDAMYEMGLLCLKSKSVEGTERGLRLVKAAAYSGHVEAQLQCARQRFLRILGYTLQPIGDDLDRLLTPTFSKEESEQCLAWLRGITGPKHAEAESQFILGRCYRKGFDILEPDVTKAIECYRKAARAGHAKAQFSLAECLRRQVWHAIREPDDCWPGRTEFHEFFALHPDYMVQRNEAIKWYMMAAKRGHPGAQFRLWYVSWLGDGGARHYMALPGLRLDEAVKWLCEAACQGHKKAIHALTSDNDFCSHDTGSDRSIGKYPCIVETLNFLAQERSNAEAAFRLAEIYSQTADNMPMANPLKVRKWLQRAAQLGHEQAIAMVMSGSDVSAKRPAFAFDETAAQAVQHGIQAARENNHYEATSSFLRAARRGDSEAQFRLAELLQNGLAVWDPGGPQCTHQAKAAWWYQAAAEQGHPEALKRLAEIGEAAIAGIVEAVPDQR